MDRFFKSASNFFKTSRKKQETKTVDEDSKDESMNSPSSQNHPGVDNVQEDVESEMESGLKNKGKLFVGGLSQSTTSKELGSYFSRFGKVSDCVVLRYPKTGKSRGFGFVTFANIPDASKALQTQVHVLDGKTVECRPFGCKNFKRRNEWRVFLGGLSFNTTKADLKVFFSRYGEVTDVVIPLHEKTKTPKGFGFLEFKDEAAAEKCLADRFVFLGERRVFISKADPRESSSTTQEQQFDDSNDSEKSWPNDSTSSSFVSNRSSASEKTLPDFEQPTELQQLLQSYFREKIASYKEMNKKKVVKEKTQSSKTDIEEVEKLLKNLLINSGNDLTQFSAIEDTDSDTSYSYSDEDDCEDQVSSLLSQEIYESTPKYSKDKNTSIPFDKEKLDLCSENVQEPAAPFKLKNTSMCPVCEWTPPDKSFETFLAHCTTPDHKMKLKERFPTAKQESIAEPKLNSEDPKDRHRKLRSDPTLTETQQNGSKKENKTQKLVTKLPLIELPEQLQFVVDQLQKDQPAKKGHQRRRKNKQPKEDTEKQEENQKQVANVKTQKVPKAKEQEENQKQVANVKTQKVPKAKEQEDNQKQVANVKTQKVPNAKEQNDQESSQNTNKTGKQKVSNTQLKIYALVKGMACIQPLSERKLSCTMCQKSIPEASDFDVLMRNVSQHLQSKTHLQKLMETEESLKNQQQVPNLDSKNENSTDENAKGNNSRKKKIFQKLENSKERNLSNAILKEEGTGPLVKNAPKETKPLTVPVVNSAVNKGKFLCLQCNFSNVDVEKFYQHLKSKSHPKGSLDNVYLQSNNSYIPKCKSCEGYLFGSLIDINLHISKCSNGKS